MKKHIINFIITALLFVMFIGFTVAVKTVDVSAVGPDMSQIGFSTLNTKVFDAVGESEAWYVVTELLGYVAILVALGFAAFGAYQLFKTKSIKKVDTKILLLAGFYVAVGLVYVIFEKIEINYRPVLVDWVLEASYPSTHTMLAVCIFISAAILFKSLLKKKLRTPVITMCVIAAVVTVLGRLASGMHWFTDIVGGVIVSAALVMLYYSFVRLFEKK